MCRATSIAPAPGGTWVYAADGTHIGTIKTPEVPANLAFGGPDMKMLFFTAHTSVLQHAREGDGAAGASVQERLTGRSSF